MSRSRGRRFAIATCAALTLGTVGVGAQQVTGTVDSHLAASKVAAGTQFTALQQRVCESAIPAPPAAGARTGGGGGRQAGPPPAAQWHSAPAKVFDV